MNEARAVKPRRPMVWVRKVHMYLGLFLFPWVLFFGVTGILFNHPGIGEATRARPLSAEKLREYTGIEPVDAQKLAQEAVETLRARGLNYRLDERYASQFHGSAAFATRGPGVKHLVLLDRQSGRGVVLTRPDRAAPAAPFAGVIERPEHRIRALESRLSNLLPKLGVDDAAPPRFALAPTVRLRLLDANGRAWNAIYDLESGSMDGRPVDASPSLSLHDLLGEMHKTHHFPPRLGPTTFWALFADFTGATLIIWALTGLLMWGQLKRGRVLGIIMVSAGLLVATGVMLATHGDLRFGRVQPNEPGGGPAETSTPNAQ